VLRHSADSNRRFAVAPFKMSGAGIGRRDPMFVLAIDIELFMSQTPGPEHDAADLRHPRKDHLGSSMSKYFAWEKVATFRCDPV
jgi:hypothetical protein